MKCDEGDESTVMVYLHMRMGMVGSRALSSCAEVRK
jgi:hypothetical protein